MARARASNRAAVESQIAENTAAADEAKLLMDAVARVIVEVCVGGDKGLTGGANA